MMQCAVCKEPITLIEDGQRWAVWVHRQGRRRPIHKVVPTRLITTRPD